MWAYIILIVLYIIIYYEPISFCLYYTSLYHSDCILLYIMSLYHSVCIIWAYIILIVY